MIWCLLCDCVDVWVFGLCVMKGSGVSVCVFVMIMCIIVVILSV